ncbi:MAG TPA: hypothetical protein VK588_10280 [Chitinophagaceae bacterium]|nr:hypothetical protein [Chitinophagaceae bacterium]
MRKGKNNRTQWVHVRVSEEEYDQLQNRIKSTTCRKMSEFIRDILLHRPLTVFYRNKSADEFLGVAIRLKNELTSIGNNLNQAVKGIHIFKDDNELGAYLFSLEIDREIMLRKADEIKGKMNQIYHLLSAENRTAKPDIIEPIFPAKSQTAAADQQENKSGQS